MAFNASLSHTVGPGDTKFMLARSATYPLWGDTPAPNTVNTDASWGVSYYGSFVPAYATAGGNGESVDSTIIDTVGAWNNNTSFGFNNPTIGGVSSTSYPVKYPIIGRDNSVVPWVYIPANSCIMVSINAGTYVGSATVVFDRWVAPGESTYHANVSVTISANLSAGTSYRNTSGGNMWIRPVTVSYSLLNGNSGLGYSPVVSVGAGLSNALPVFTGNATAGSWGFTGTADPRIYFLPLSISPEFSNSKLPWASTRLNAVAALFTNTTKILNKEGTVLWGRINPVITNPFTASYVDVQTLHPAEKRFMDLENGCYAYNPPSTDLSRFDSYLFSIGIDNVQVQIPCHRLDNDAMCAIGFFSDPDGGTSLAINLDYHIEFRTSSTLFEIGVSATPIEALHSAQVALLKAGFFFHNFDHIAAIKAVVAGLASLHPLMRVAAPIAQGLYRSTSVALTKSTRASRPAATSGQGAGMMGPRAAPTQTMVLPPRVPQSNANAVANRMMGLNRAMSRQRKRGGLSMFLSRQKRKGSSRRRR